MSDTTSLTQLAKFIGQSNLGDASDGGRAIAVGNLAAKPQRRRVANLLGVVLALSARTRRMVLPHVGIDLDVFSPNGGRAVRLVMRKA